MIIIIDIKKILKEKKYLDSIILVLSKYYDFLNIFSRNEANKLFLYRLNNYKIELKFDIEFNYDYLYSIS